MARTSEMKLHTYKVIDRDGNEIWVAYFYDTHIRLWTAYLMDHCGNQIGCCEYDPSAVYAIQYALFQNFGG